MPFLRHAPLCHALMLTSAEVERLDQKYDKRRGIIGAPLRSYPRRMAD
jgi:hypothetical protein